MVVKSHCYSNTKYTHTHDTHVCLANDTSITCDLHCKSICMSMCVRATLVTQFGMDSSANKWWRLKQSIQLVHVSLSSWHNAVLGTQLGKVCYYSITHFSAPSSQSSHISPALDRLPALPLQDWLTGLQSNFLPTSPS